MEILNEKLSFKNRRKIVDGIFKKNMAKAYKYLIKKKSLVPIKDPCKKMLGIFKWNEQHNMSF